MSIRVSATPLIADSLVVGMSGLGVLAESVPSTGENGAGYLYNDLSLPTDNGKEVRGEIVVWPSSGTLAANEDSSFEFTGAADGSYSFQYQLYVDGVLTGSPATVSLIVGGATTVSATLATVGVTAYQATIVVGNNTAVNATLGAIGVSAFDATVITTTSTTVNASAATVGVTAFQASVVAGGNVSVNATLATARVSTYPATVVTSTIVSASLASATVTAFDATVVTGVVINATLASVSLSTLAASVRYDVIVSASLAGVSVATYLASIVEGNAYIVPRNNMTVSSESRIMRVPVESRIMRALR